MALLTLLTLSKISISFVALYYLYRYVTTGARQRAFSKRHGCLPARKLYSIDPLLHLDVGYRFYKAYHRHQLLDFQRNEFDEHNARTLTIRGFRGCVFFTDDPENVKSILATDFHAWGLGEERIKILASSIGYGIFCTEGAAWKHSRDMLRPCFERSQVADVDMMERHTKRLIDQLPKDGTTVDLQHKFRNLTMDIATEFLFGQSTNAQDPGRVDEEADAFVAGIDYCGNPFESDPVKKWGFLGVFLPDKKFKQSAKAIQDFGARCLNEAIASREAKGLKGHTDRHTFLDELLSATDDRVSMRTEALNLLLAGRDTTAALLSNTVFELSKRPDIIARLRREIAEHIGDKQPTYEQLKEMKYLRAIINESQRLYPIIPNNSRQAFHDTILPRGGGPDGKAPVFVPKGAIVAYHSYSMQRRPDLYGEDAAEFEPARWLAGEHISSPLRPGWGYIPFSGGPRVCIGQNFALTEAGYVVVRLLQEFPILESRDSSPWQEKLTIICTGLNGCKVALRN